MAADMLVAARATYATEPLSDALWSELEPLLVANQAEIPHFVAEAPIAPRRQVYQRMQEVDALRLYVARADEHRLIGYMAVLVTHSMHQQSVKVGALDVLYVTPEYRGTVIGTSLVRHAHADLRALGVSALFQHVKAGPLSLGPLLRRLGYEHVEEVWAINLDRKE